MRQTDKKIDSASGTIGEIEMSARRGGGAVYLHIPYFATLTKEVT